tara:strand:- start:1060 stop:1911 length:852 start_codon:yes stop_codon:yes gene_type:complete
MHDRARCAGRISLSGAFNSGRAWRGLRKTRALVFFFTVLFSGLAFAHPEDELCDPSRDAMDPQLCAMLAQLNSAEGSLNQQSTLAVDVLERRGVFETLGRYVVVGARHILPGGLDHILFVLAMFLAARRAASLIWQISAFTLAHTITLALAATGAVKLPASFVESFIAFTIAFVAIENLLFRDIVRWRPLVVFIFGLIHGLGFASFFSALELPVGLFWSALIGFNIGVELGQLSVIALAALAVHLVLRTSAEDVRYQKWIVRPGSALIGLSGLWWGISALLDL